MTKITKSDFENNIIKMSAESLAKAISCSGKTVATVADESYMSKGYLDELKSGKKRINIVHLVKIADSINKPPSELFPIEWQKNTGAAPSINTKMLQRAITKVFELQHAIIRKLSEGEISALISIVYDKMQKGESFQDADILKFTKDAK